MRHLRGDRPKELLQVGGRPLLAHGLADLASAGIREALVVVSPDKGAIRSELGDRAEGITLHYVLQPEPLGVADALSLAEEFTAAAPFVCLLPDNVWRGTPSMSAQLVRALAQVPDHHLVGLIELPTSELARYGATGYVETGPVHDDALVPIRQVLDKGVRPPSHSATTLKGFPVDLYQPDLFERIRALRRRSSAAELDDTPLLQQIAKEGRLSGVVLHGGQLFDCGIPEGYRSAQDALEGTGT